MKNYSGGYETHFPILAASVAMTKGPVIEFGCGWFSTPMLHKMCEVMGRDLLTIESDREWASNFQWMMSKTTSNFSHGFATGGHWMSVMDSLVEYIQPWGVAFIDYKPGEEREDIAAFMADKADIVVCHDSERDYDVGTNYGYDNVKHLYKYVTEYRLMRPYTLILSNTMEFPLSEEEQTWRPENL